MRSRLLCISILLVAAAAASRSGSPAIVHADDSWWLSDYQAALKNSEETGKPILLEFR